MLFDRFVPTVSPMWIFVLEVFKCNIHHFVQQRHKLIYKQYIYYFVANTAQEKIFQILSNPSGGDNIMSGFFIEHLNIITIQIHYHLVCP